MIKRITSLRITRYSDNHTTRIYVGWCDPKGRPGITAGEWPTTNTHMLALVDRAEREGIELREEAW